MTRRLFVKICGITRFEDAELAVELGASALGFVFWPGSPRFIDPYRAGEIVDRLPLGVTPIGVFVDQPLDQVNGIVSVARLGGVQLHGSERPAFARGVKRPVLKVVPVRAGEVVGDVDAWPAPVTMLVDAYDPERKGGTGRTVDWTAAARIARQRRTVLAGGLDPDNVAAAIAAVQPFGVDVSSGVEARPGVKDAGRLRAFFAAVRGMETGEVTA
jgi:phosphoribosylanthranilate isomerase